MENIFNHALKIYVWFSLHHFPIPQYFLYPSKKLLPAVAIRLHIEEKQSRIYSLQKEKTLSWYVNS